MKNTINYGRIAIILVIIALTACNKNKYEVVTLDLNNIDTTVNPAEDFFRFVNGKWLDNTDIPADEGRWGSFNELIKSNDKLVLSVLEKAGKNGNYDKDSDQKKASNFYVVGMDSSLAEERGISPVAQWIDLVNSVSDINQLQDVLAKLHVAGFGGFFGESILGDLMNSSINALYIVPNALGLPNRDYYTKDDSVSNGIRDKYVAHIKRMLELVNDDDTDYNEKAKLVYDIEYQLALASLTPIEKRNIPLLYNKMDIKELTENTPSIDWPRYLNDIGIAEIDSLIVTEPKLMKETEKILTDIPVENIKWYLKWHVIHKSAPYLNDEVVMANFDFYGKVIKGTEKIKTRWERVLNVTNSALGEALGKLYVDEVFPPEAKAEALEMVDNILLAFGDRIRALDWMTDSTKDAALYKLSKFKVKIGYPDKWKDYSELIVENEGDSYSYLGNVLNASVFTHHTEIAKIGKPVDKEEWHMNPQTVNAYYSPLNNEIVFPAAILQPPFYYYKADPAINFGGIGAVIGHEISHGFDDQGSRFDAEGNMINWWTKTDKENFEKRAEKLVAQFDAYEPLEGLNIQGKLTLGENIGDLGGVNVAYDGLMKYFEKHGKPSKIGEYNQEQRFFLSWGTIWRTKYRDETLRTQIMSDPHSPGMYRATGPLVNLETFYAAFDVNEGDAMWLPDSMRVKIW